LLAAVLLLVRAWFAAGQPCRRDRDFQSFTDWERVVGGVLEVAGVEGFLGNRKAWRAESDYEQQAWDAHFFWLAKTFPDGGTFTCREVKDAAIGDLQAFAGPPNLSDPQEKRFSEDLGYAYRSHRASESLGLVLVKMGTKHNSVNAYAVVPESSYFKPTGGDLLGGDGGDGGGTSTHTRGKNSDRSSVTTSSPDRGKNTFSPGKEGVSPAPVASIAPETDQRSPRKPMASDLPCSGCGSEPGGTCPGVPADPTGELDGLCDSRADALVNARNAWASYVPGDLTDLLFFD
jgi:hypothetical protein